ncbi:MAG: kynureninase [Thalassobaculales bacterium]
MIPASRDACLALDAADPLAGLRERFVLPEGLIYLDGNSLGALPRAAAARVARVVEQEWGGHLIAGWTADGWMDWPERLGDRLAPLIGAAAGEVIVAETTSINLFKLVAAALHLRPGRRKILSDTANFPTDLYMIQGLADLAGHRHRLVTVEEERLIDAIDEDTAVVTATHVNYKTGRMHDLAAVTAAARAKGALVVWDLAHSAGAVPLDLKAAGADFAVGCGYKYLNGGPGAPAFLYVAERLQQQARQPLTGWLGHAEPFAFDLDYRPASGIRRFKCSSPPVLGLAALEAALDVFADADMAALRAKSMALTELFIRRVEIEAAGHGFVLASPGDPNRRGSQVSFHHPQGYPVMQALIRRGVVGDFRAPDIVRFGFAPLYVRHVDVWDAAAILGDIMRKRSWDQPELHRRASVT